NVQLSSTATQLVQLRNRPPAGTCLPPPEAPVCQPVCVVTFAPDALGHALGVGLTDATQGFRIEGNIELPFALGTPDPSCEGQGAVLRRDLALPVVFDAGDVVREGVSSTLVLESNDP